VTGVRWTFGSLRVGTVLGREPNGDRPAPLALAGAFFRARPLHRSRRWGSGDHWPYKNAVVRVNFSGDPEEAHELYGQGDYVCQHMTGAKSAELCICVGWSSWVF
jgi:hypothetical protein